MIEAVIFDLDGLLVDSTPLHQEAFKKFLEKKGKLSISPRLGREGMRIIDIVQEYKDIYNLEGDVNQLYRERQQIFFELAQTNLRLFPDVMPLLIKIKNRGLRIALATSGDRVYTELVFDKFPQLKSFFSVVMTSEDVIRGKPYPDVYLKTAQALQVAPSLCVVLEDSVNGILAAKTAGMQVICVPNRYYLQADYSQADRIFSTLGEVSNAILEYG